MTMKYLGRERRPTIIIHTCVALSIQPNGGLAGWWVLEFFQLYFLISQLICIFFQSWGSSLHLTLSRPSTRGLQKSGWHLTKILASLEFFFLEFFSVIIIPFLFKLGQKAKKEKKKEKIFPAGTVGRLFLVLWSFIILYLCFESFEYPIRLAPQGRLDDYQTYCSWIDVLLQLGKLGGLIGGWEAGWPEFRSFSCWERFISLVQLCFQLTP